MEEEEEKEEEEKEEEEKEEEEEEQGDDIVWQCVGCDQHWEDDTDDRLIYFA